MQESVVLYLRYMRRKNYSKRTLERATWTLSWFAEFLGRDILTGTTEEVEAWLDSRTLSPRSRHHYTSDLSGFYRWALLESLALSNPVARVVRPRLARLVPRPPADSDIAVALGAATARVRAYLLLGAYQGMRISEMAALDREDILEHNAPPVLIVHGKGSKERVVPLHPETLAALRVAGLPRRGAVFLNSRGNRVIPHSVGNAINDHFRALNLPVTAHQLRHWFATNVYRTSDLRTTQELLGHSSPVATAVYSAWSPERGLGAVLGLAVDTVL